MNNEDSLSEKQIMVLLLFFCALLACLCMIGWGTGHLESLKNFFFATSYYVIFALVFIWAVALINACRHKKAEIINFFKLHVRPIFLTFLLAFSIFLSVPHYHRVLSDETNLLGVARTMTYEKRVENLTEGYWYYERFNPIGRVDDKRPLLFPFFIQIFHVFLGYKPANVFLLNFFSFWGLLFSLYLILRPYLTEILAYAGLMLVAAQPMISLIATSGCFEIFNLFFLAISILSFRWFLKARSSESFFVLYLNLMMLSQIRYESVVLFVCVVVAF